MSFAAITTAWRFITRPMSALAENSPLDHNLSPANGDVPVVQSQKTPANHWLRAAGLFL